MYIILLSLLIIYLVITAILTAQAIKSMKNAVITEGARLNLYRGTIVQSWLFLVVLLLICLFAGISFYAVGLRPTSLSGYFWFNIITFIAAIGLLAVMLYQIAAYLLSAKYRAKTQTKLAADAAKNHYSAVLHNIVIPRSKKEKRLFIAVSLTAAIGEEIIWRGMLFYLLQAIFPGLPVAAIVIIASLPFGLAHLYQGASGFIKTTLAGLLFGCLYVASGSLIPGIMLHFVVDFAAVFLLTAEKCDNKHTSPSTGLDS